MPALPIDATANDMAISMFGNGITIISATYAGVAAASGTYTGGDASAPDITPAATGVILSTANATAVTNCSGDVNAAEGTGTDHGTSSDSDLDSNLLIAGGSVQTVLIAGDNTASLKLGQSGDFDLLSNDSSMSSMDLMITQINGQPVSVGDVVSRFKAKTPQSILTKVLWEHTAPPLFHRCIRC